MTNMMTKSHLNFVYEETALLNYVDIFLFWQLSSDYRNNATNGVHDQHRERHYYHILTTNPNTAFPG